MKHTLSSHFLDQTIEVHVIGVGGTGSQVLTGLAQLHVSMLALGHPGGLKVTAWDPDFVSAANVGRQLFSAADIGQSKPAVLVSRLNAFYGLKWKSKPCKFRASLENSYDPRIVISCVDTAKARADIHHFLTKSGRDLYWLDCGNTANAGQVILGQVGDWTTDEVTRSVAGQPSNSPKLPTVTQMFPQLLNPKFKEDNTPSCSLAQALKSQELFVNRAVSTFALQLLWDLFRHGGIDNHGYFINLRSGRVNPLTVPEPAKKAA